jgi:L-histidine Nalpha-methyltransferase / hercynylcysteine S-oxide synthase
LILTTVQYAQYMYDQKIEQVPASWIIKAATTPETADGYTKDQANGDARGLPDSFLAGKSVRTMYGPVPLRLVLDWPVFASYDELAGCAAWMGGRIPTFEETRSIYAYVEAQKKALPLSKLTNNVPAVNGYVVF